MSISDYLPWNWGRKHDEPAPVPVQTERSLSTLQNDMNSLFDRFFDRSLASVTGDRSLLSTGFTTMPTVEVAETDDEITVTAELEAYPTFFLGLSARTSSGFP